MEMAQRVLINPVIQESSGEWDFEEGCLSVPGLSWNIIRPKVIYITGYDLSGNEISIEADELESRLYQHEMDHLDGKLLLEYLEEDQRSEAKRILRQRVMDRQDNTFPGLMVLPEVPQKVNRIAYLGTPEIAVKPLRACMHSVSMWS